MLIIAERVNEPEICIELFYYLLLFSFRVESDVFVFVLCIYLFIRIYNIFDLFICLQTWQ